MRFQLFRDRSGATSASKAPRGRFAGRCLASVAVVLLAARLAAQEAATPVVFEQSPLVQVPIGVADYSLIDLDRDGDLDLLTWRGAPTVPGDGSIRVVENLGTTPPTFAIHAISAPWNNSEQLPALGDLNGDGFPDLVLSHAFAPDPVTSLVWRPFVGREAGWFGHARHITHFPDASGTWHCLVLNTAPNGFGDIIVANSATTSPSVVHWKNSGNSEPTFLVEILNPNGGPGGTSFPLRRGDFNGDGDTDFLVRTRDLYLGSGPPDETFAFHLLPLPSLPETAALGGVIPGSPLDAAHTEWHSPIPVPDCLVPENVEQTVTTRLFANQGGAIPAFTELSVFHQELLSCATPMFDSATLGDFDDDGLVDVAGVSADCYAWFRQGRAGETPWQSHCIGGSFFLRGIGGNPRAADFDGDGDVDILVFPSSPAATSGQFSWHENRMPRLRLLDPVIVGESGDGRVQPGAPATLRGEIQRFGRSEVSDVVLMIGGGEGVVSIVSPIIELGDVSAIAPYETIGYSIPIETSPEAMCGSTVTLTASVTWNDAEVSIAQAELTFGTPTFPTSIAGESPGLPIPDDGVSSLERSAAVDTPGGTIGESLATLSIAHPSRGDLLVTVTHQSGAVATVFSGAPGDSTDNVHGTFPIMGWSGLPIGGSVTLTVTDRVAGNAGTLTSWSVRLVRAEPDYTCSPVLPGDLPLVPFVPQNLASGNWQGFSGDVIIGPATPTAGAGLSVTYSAVTPNAFLPFWFGGWSGTGIPDLVTTPGRLYAFRAAMSASQTLDTGSTSRLRVEAGAGSTDHGYIMVAPSSHPFAIPTLGIDYYLAYLRPFDADTHGPRTFAFDGTDNGNPFGTPLTMSMRALEIGSSDAAQFLGAPNAVAAFDDFAFWHYINYGNYSSLDFILFEGGTGERVGPRVRHADDDGISGGAAEWLHGDEPSTAGEINTVPGALYRASYDASADDGGGDGTFPQFRFLPRANHPSFGDEYVVRGNGPALDTVGAGNPATYEQFWVGHDIVGAPGGTNVTDDLVLSFGMINLTQGLADRDGTADLWALRLEELAPDDPNIE